MKFFVEFQLNLLWRNLAAKTVSLKSSSTLRGLNLCQANYYFWLTKIQRATETKWTEVFHHFFSFTLLESCRVCADHCSFKCIFAEKSWCLGFKPRPPGQEPAVKSFRSTPIVFKSWPNPWLLIIWALLTTIKFKLLGFEPGTAR